VNDQREADIGAAFGPFRLFAAQRLLLEHEKPLRLGSRALEILTVLLENPGALVTKEELVARVWPDTFVEEGNLRVHMAALRRALGDGQAGNRYVVTVPGRGYRFVAPVSMLEPSAPAPPKSRAEAASNLPLPLTRMVGRAEIVAALGVQLAQRRFITIVGAGGIGKTTVAVAIADAVMPNYRDKVAFVDLSPLTDAALIPSMVAAILGLPTHSENALTALIAFLSDKELLLVLDSCEHVVDAVANMVERVLEAAPGVHILATSREPLRAAGERLYRLLPLGVPPSSVGLKAEEAQAFPAIQLFVERAAAVLDGFELTDANAPIVADICRRLDGIALAIELAAGRIDAFGLRELAARLDDRFRLLTRGRRTALPRHQTLSTTLDWSYQLLPESERTVLHRLAVFAGRFTLEAVEAVISGGESVVDQVANLVTKSLITANIGGDVVYYRLLETTRAYALDKLEESGEGLEYARRHADYFRALFRRAELEWDRRPTAEWVETYVSQTDNVRAALEWAFSASGDVELGIDLTIVTVPLWLQLSLMDECRKHVDRALAAARARPEHDPRRDMQLNAALGSSLVYTSMARVAWGRALEIAKSIGDNDYQLRSLWGLWVDGLNTGGFKNALSLANQFYGVAAHSSDPLDALMGDRMIGIAQHFIGEQLEARQHIDRMLARYVTPIRASHIARYQFDQRVTAHAFQARILWLLGFPDQAMQIVGTMVEDALSIGHALSLCNALGQGACPISLFCGNLVAAERYLNMLLDHTAKHALEAWHAWALCFRGAVLIRRGEDAAGLQALQSILHKGPEFRALPRYLAVFGELAQAMGRSGEIPQALAAIELAIERSEQREERWYLAELLRIKGELLRRDSATSAARAAADCFQASLDWARRQAALAWELRAATSLARLQRDNGDVLAARDVLTPVYRRFTEGFSTTDLKDAKELLDELQ
jgi:predicted ATPase/DNA-binding winged helix-turn-helix (wHTH) protein